MSLENEVIAELRLSVDELGNGVVALAQRVSTLSVSLTDVTELQRKQQELGEKAIVAVERANAIARKLEEVKQTVVPREEVDRKARVEVLRRQRMTRRIAISLLAFMLTLYGTIFAVAPLENSRCVINGPKTTTAQSVCNLVSPFESHPLGGRLQVARVLQQQIIRNNGRIDQLEAQVQAALALANRERAKSHRAQLPIVPDPSLGMRLDHEAPASYYDWSSKTTLVMVLLLVGGVTALLVWARRNDNLDSEESASIE